ncbi:hypothetical protein Bhyg_17355, partial [Pseudolycoriella hygida]
CEKWSLDCDTNYKTNYFHLTAGFTQQNDLNTTRQTTCLTPSCFNRLSNTLIVLIASQFNSKLSLYSTNKLSLYAVWMRCF